MYTAFSGVPYLKILQIDHQLSSKTPKKLMYKYSCLPESAKLMQDCYSNVTRV